MESLLLENLPLILGSLGILVAVVAGSLFFLIKTAKKKTPASILVDALRTKEARPPRLQFNLLTSRIKPRVSATNTRGETAARVEDKSFSWVRAIVTPLAFAVVIILAVTLPLYFMGTRREATQIPAQASQTPPATSGRIENLSPAPTPQTTPPATQSAELGLFPVNSPRIIKAEKDRRSETLYFPPNRIVDIRGMREDAHFTIYTQAGPYEMGPGLPEVPGVIFEASFQALGEEPEEIWVRVR